MNRAYMIRLAIADAMAKGDEARAARLADRLEMLLDALEVGAE